MMNTSNFKQQYRGDLWTVLGRLLVLVPVILIVAILVVPRLKSMMVKGKVWYVSPAGKTGASGTSDQEPLASIQEALDRAQPGDTINLADGDYRENLRSVRSGTKKAPVTIRGTQRAIIYGDTTSRNRIFEINHDYLVLDGFQINGHNGTGEKKDDYKDKLIYAIGTKDGDGVEGLKITNMLIQNAGGECVRLRYFAVSNEISHSTIRNCGVYDFKFDGGGKNGEGVYIGTAPEQRADGKNPNDRVDVSRDNWIHHNTFDTQGNECVDIKEGSRDNLVEYNTCTGQKDSKSGGLDARGDYNIFRNNTIENNKGAGVRLGGDSKEDGIHNEVYDNVIRGNANGGIKVQRLPQDKLCGNRFENNGDADISGSNTGEYNPSADCH